MKPARPPRFPITATSGQTLPDAALVEVVKACEGETAIQLKWLKTRMKQAAPQALVVAT
jgi:hypothetical protein